MPNEPQWVSPLGVTTINAALVGVTGEPHSVLDPRLLESACAKPRNHWDYGERDVAVLATHLLFGIIRNHPFLQGNKRTGFAAMIGFLDCNGFQLSLADDVAWADHIIDVIAGARTEESFAIALRQVLSPIQAWR